MFCINKQYFLLSSLFPPRVTFFLMSSREEERKEVKKTSQG